jgi:hypothetical protein
MESPAVIVVPSAGWKNDTGWLSVGVATVQAVQLRARVSSTTHR